MTWTIDTAHSEINFSVRHMMISTVRGQFEKISGKVDFNEDDPARSTVEIQIDASSINTREPQRDGHLKSPDFLDVEKYPTLTFKSKNIEVIDEDHALVAGDLTIRDITREVVLDTYFAGMAKSPFGTINAGFNASTRINRKDWGLVWNVALETGGVLVSEEIKIDIELEIIKQAEGELELVAA